MPKFFLPDPDGAPTTSQVAEETYAAIKRFAQEQTGWEPTERRIFRVEYEHNNAEQVAEVGSRDNAVGETCIAILETPNWYLLCTSSRGVVTGVPVFIGLPHTVIEFDP